MLTYPQYLKNTIYSRFISSASGGLTLHCNRQRVHSNYEMIKKDHQERLGGKRKFVSLKGNWLETFQDRLEK